MEAMIDPIYESLTNNLQFVNISTENCTLYEWKPKNIFTSSVLDQSFILMNNIEDVYFPINKANSKTIFIKKDGVFYSAGVKGDPQNQIIEAFLDHVIERFNKKYNVDEFKSYAMVHPSVFGDFKFVIEDVLETFHELQLVKKVRVPCKVCGKEFDLIVKTSVIDNNKSDPVPIVCLHEGHALLCYIDKSYKCRATGKVNFAG